MKLKRVSIREAEYTSDMLEFKEDDKALRGYSDSLKTKPHDPQMPTTNLLGTTQEPIVHTGLPNEPNAEAINDLRLSQKFSHMKYSRYLPTFQL